MTIFHLKQSIAGCLRNNRIGTIDFLEDGKGNPLSDTEARIELNKLLAKGHTVMPVGTDCEGFDVFGGGCPGHEPLAGSELARKYFETGRPHVCFVGEDNDECLSDLMTVMVIKHDEQKGFETSYNEFFPYAVLVNSHGDELTARDAGL